MVTTPTPAHRDADDPMPVGDVASERWRVLVVEDDDGDALLVRELLSMAMPDAEVERAETLAEARRLVRGAACVVLDVGLPDADGTAGVERLTADAPETAVVVLTGAASERLGIAAVAAGAQDYLVKGRVDEHLLARSIRYAVERQRAARLSRHLVVSERQRSENTRMERALTPPPLVRSPDLAVTVRYRAGREGAEIGGDFYDAVEATDGSLHLLIGDVAGHDPDAAALAARLRSAWRALTLAGLDQLATIEILDGFLRTEVEELTFATLSTAVVAPDRRAASLLIAGHPPPILVSGRCRLVGDARPGHPLGVVPAPVWEPVEVELAPATSLLLYTDGLIEGFAAPGSPERLGTEAVLQIVEALCGREATEAGILDALLADVERRNGGPLADDVALCLVSMGDGPDRGG
ncbi:MAG: PP2C family protein-serine/threonine phosphatase [Acidimicrobiia bacterium]